MRRWLPLGIVATLACKRAPEAKPLATDEGKAKMECKLVAGGRIQADTRVEAGCQVVVGEPYTVTKGATLRIAAGTLLSFKKGAYLLVEDGALVVEGTKEAPVVMTSAEPKPTPGDWGGIVIASSKPSSLAFAVVEYASSDPTVGAPVLADAGRPKVTGAPLGDPRELEWLGLLRSRGSRSPVADGKPSIHLRAAAQVALSDVTVRHGGKVGVGAEGNDPFVRVERLHLEDLGGVGMDVPAGALGKVASVTGPEPVRVRGRLATSQTWPKIEGGIVVASLEVEAADKAPVALLRLASEQVVRVEPGANLSFGSGGALVASKVLFTSAAKKPQPGDWAGLRFGRSPGTRVDGCVVEYAGAGHKPTAITFDSKPSSPSPTAALSVDGPLVDLTVVATVFRNNAGPGIGNNDSPFHEGCEHLDAPKHGNRSIGQPLCVYATSTSGGSYADVPAPTGNLMPDAGAAFGYGGLGVSGTGGTSDGVGLGTIGGFGGDAGPKGLGSGKAPPPKP